MYNKYIGKAIFFFLLFFIPTEACPEQKMTKGVRASLVEEGAVKALYTVDGTTTLVEGEGLVETLGKICAKRGLKTEPSDETSGLHCRGFFNAYRTTFEQKEAYIITSSSLEPFIYKAGGLPSYGELGRDGGASIETLSGALLYEYMYGLCKKRGGEPAFVVQRRYGRFTRLTKVSPAEAFAQMTDPHAGPWFFGCEGRMRFAVERVYAPADGAVIRFFPGRALEGVDFVRADDAQTIAVLKAYGERETINPDFLEDMVWEIASLKMGFVRTMAGVRFEGSYRGKGDCGVITIKEIERDSAAPATAKSYSYRFCNNERASLVSRR